MKKHYKYLLMFTLIVMSAISINFGNSYYHEHVHKQNAIYHGCKEYEMKASIFGKSYFKCLERSSTQQQLNDQYNLDTINEIVTYNLMSLNETIYICTIIIVFSMMMFSKGE